MVAKKEKSPESTQVLRASTENESSMVITVKQPPFRPPLSCKNSKKTFSFKSQVLDQSTLSNNSGLSWLTHSYIRNLSKINIVHCDTSKTKTVDASSTVEDKVSDNEIKPVVRQFRLIQDEVEDFLQRETPMERLKRSLTKNEMTKRYNPDIEVYRKSLVYAITVVSFYGFITGCQEGKEGFLRRNRFTLYTYPKAMYNRMMNTMVQVGLKYTLKANFKFLGYIAPAIALEKCISIYRNKSSPLHFTAGFGLSGSLNTFMMGPKGMISGGLISGSFGLILGSCYYLISSAVGFDQESLNRKAVYNLIEQKRSFRRPEPITNVPESRVLNRSTNAQDDNSEEDSID